MVDRLKILFSGMVAGDPGQGGASWAVLQYVLGLAELGHDVLLVEPVRSESKLWDGDVESYFRALPHLEGRAAVLLEGSEQTIGLPFGAVAKFAAEAELLINVSGMLRDARLVEAIPTRAFLDLDPGFNQAWHLTGEDMGFDRHTHFLTVGQGVGSAWSFVPDCDREWTKTLPPVHLASWPVAPAAVSYGFTTIGNWRSYGSVELHGIRYGQRAHSFRRLLDLPARTKACFQPALAIHADEGEDLRALDQGGWELVDPARVAGTPFAYREFIGASQAELCVAKSGYVDSRSGWFSDRSACYLASGRPVLAQATGFETVLPCGEGLIAYDSAQDAAEGAECLLSSWQAHCSAARELAAAHFDSGKVLTEMLAALSGSAAAG
jgi:hypothetical protein